MAVTPVRVGKRGNIPEGKMTGPEAAKYFVDRNLLDSESDLLDYLAILKDEIPTQTIGKWEPHRQFALLFKLYNRVNSGLRSSEEVLRHTYGLRAALGGARIEEERGRLRKGIRPEKAIPPVLRKFRSALDQHSPDCLLSECNMDVRSVVWCLDPVITAYMSSPSDVRTIGDVIAVLEAAIPLCGKRLGRGRKTMLAIAYFRMVHEHILLAQQGADNFSDDNSVRYSRSKAKIGLEKFCIEATKIFRITHSKRLFDKAKQAARR